MASAGRRSGCRGASRFACTGQNYPSGRRRHPPAIRLGAHHPRPLRHGAGRLDGARSISLGQWLAHTTGASFAIPAGRRRALHQIAVGPVHAGIIEPGHFRFTANGEYLGAAGGAASATSIKRHRETDDGRDARSRPPSSPARVSGDSTVAYALRLRSRRRDRRLRSTPPPRAVYLRALMAELERPRQPFRRYRRHLQRRLVRADARAMRHPARTHAAAPADACFGHRLMRDIIVPGGVARDYRRRRR